ncbi:MAG TPA: PEP/pyruvate-binding domain-containing protein [Acidimicrobiales bacterium]|nr:PEP/pyruvate-binding domain-containing protein [Acidimicrobiales bacterium]
MSHTRLSDESTSPPGVIGLDHPASRDPAVVGAKAAALAVARGAGLPALYGFVVSTAATSTWRGADPPDILSQQLKRAWRHLGGAGSRSLIVRSSSPHEDGETSSMAGQFTSVLDVDGWDDLLAAVQEVIDSGHGAPMAVLVQRQLRPAWGGVLFGADPVTGSRDRLVVACVPGGPDQLVSGSISGGQFSLSPRGRLLETTGDVPGAVRARSVRRSLAQLAHDAAELFGGPQDIEWALEHDGRLVLLQSRPITTVGAEAQAATGPVLGPGPLAETFPVALSPLEEDLWIPPLRDGLRIALELLGATSARRLGASPVVVALGGRPAVDLELLGLSPVRRPWYARLDPRPPARQALAAWRVGRLRAALPSLAGDILREIDTDLRSVPRLDTLTSADLLGLMERSAEALRSLHGYEVLAGQLLSADTTAPTAASRALAVLSTARGVGAEVDDESLLAENPVLLSLLPPRIGTPPALPAAPTGPRAAASSTEADPDDPATRREALRLRVRWVQELTARAALALGAELVRRGVLADPADVRDLSLDDLHAALAGQLSAREVRAVVETPLPRAFRQAGDVIVPVAAENTRRGGGGGRGAGGGRGMGRVHDGTGTPSEGAVLVVEHLDPSLAPLLPGLAGLVAETGSVLSHLAILAREYGVPTVVDLAGARERYPAGTWVVVDGATGEVSPVESEEWRGAA